MIFTSIFGIVALVLLARALGFARNPVLDDTAARTLADAALPGFRSDEVALEASGRGARIVGIDGRVAIVRPHGDRWVVRLAA